MNRYELLADIEGEEEDETETRRCYGYGHYSQTEECEIVRKETMRKNEGRRKSTGKRRKKKRKRKRGNKNNEDEDETNVRVMFHNICGLRRRDELACEQMIEKRIDVRLMQETKAQYEHVISLTEGFGMHIVPAKKKKGVQGGLACVVRKEYRERVIQLTEKSDNKQWLRIVGDEKKGMRDIYMANIYIPPNDRMDYSTDDEEEEEESEEEEERIEERERNERGRRGRKGRIGELRQKVMDELIIEIEKYRARGIVIVGGDFNVHMKANGDEKEDREGLKLKSYAEANELMIVNLCAGKCSGQYTWQRAHKVGGMRKSTLDYVLVPNEHAQYITSMTIMNEKDASLGSDHNPIILEVKVPRHTTTSSSPKPCPMWNLTDITQEQKDRMMACASEAIDKKWNEEVNEMEKITNNKEAIVNAATATLVEAISIAAAEAIGATVPSKRKAQWVTPALRQLFAERDEKQAMLAQMSRNKEDEGEEWERRVDERRQLQKTIRKKMKETKREKAGKKYDAAEDREISERRRWAIFHQLIASHTSTEIEVIEDREGNIHTTAERKKEAMREYQIELGRRDEEEYIQNKDEDEIRRIREAQETVMKKLREMRERDKTMDEELDKDITQKEVANAVKALINGKAAGLDSVKAEMLKYGGDSVKRALARLYNLIMKNEIWPEQWQLGVITPIFKGGNKSNLDDYRNITVLSVISKVFEMIVNKRLMEWSEKLEKIYDEQGGFRPKRGCLDQIFILNEILTYRKERREATVATFIDVKKAYDKVWREGLWVKMNEMGVDGRLWRVIQEMYKRVRRKVKMGEGMTEEFNVEVGVAQGSVLSPFLYSCFINGLIERLREKNIGIEIAGEKVALLLYADDIVLVMEDEEQMKEALKVLDEYAGEWKFQYNPKKSKVVVYGTKRQREELKKCEWNLGGKKLEIVEEYKYLGLEMGRDIARWRTVLNRKIITAEQVMRRVIVSGFRRGHMKAEQCVKIWKGLIRPILEYGLEVISGPKATMKKLETVQHKMGCAILGLPTSTSATYVRSELGLVQIATRQDDLRLRWWRRLAVSKQNRLLYKIWMKRCEQVREMRTRGRLSICVKLKEVLLKHGFENEWMDPMSVTDISLQQWEKRVEDAMKEHEQKIIEEKKEENREKLGEQMEKVVLEEPSFKAYLRNRNTGDGVWLQSRCRSNMLRVLDVIGRQQRPEQEREQRMCKMCNREEETVMHFVARCTSYTQQRQQLIQIAQQRLRNECEDGTEVERQMNWNNSDTIADIAMAMSNIDMDEKTAAKLNRAGMNYLSAIWKERTRIMTA